MSHMHSTRHLSLCKGAQPLIVKITYHFKKGSPCSRQLPFIFDLEGVGSAIAPSEHFWGISYGGPRASSENESHEINVLLSLCVSAPSLTRCASPSVPCRVEASIYRRANGTELTPAAVHVVRFGRLRSGSVCVQTSSPGSISRQRSAHNEALSYCVSPLPVLKASQR
jgi:hypothetical protein